MSYLLYNQTLLNLKDNSTFWSFTKTKPDKLYWSKINLVINSGLLFLFIKNGRLNIKVGFDKSLEVDKLGIIK
jgi:hypothetical protein